MKKGLVLLLLFLLLISLITADSNSNTVNEWKMFGRNLNNSRFYPGTVNITKMGILWNYTTNGSINSLSPAVAGDFVYVGSRDKKIYALNASTGQHIWNFTTLDKIDSSPAISEGKIYFGSDDNKVYSLNATTGEQMWNYTTNGIISYSSPAVWQQAVYVGSSDYSLYALNKTTGTQLWNFSTIGAITSAPAVANNSVYFGSGWSDNSIYALDAFNGSLLWNFSAGGDITTSALVAEGKVFFGSIDSWFGFLNSIYALNSSTGQHIWNYSAMDYIESSPAYSSGVVYFGTDEDVVYALNASTGTQLWNYTSTYDVTSSPVVSSDKLFVGTIIGLIILNTSNGDHLWNYSMSLSTFASPIIANNTIYIGSSDQNLYAFRAGEDENPINLLGSPTDNSLKNSTDPVDVSFNCYASDDQGIVNISLYMTNKTNQSFSLNVSQSNIGKSINKTWTMSMGNGTYTWGCLAYDNIGQKIWSENRSLVVDGTLIEYFDFYGYTKYTNGSIINETAVRMNIYTYNEGMDLQKVHFTRSDNAGFFNITDIRIYQNRFYKPTIKHSDEDQVDYIGASLPEFPYTEIQNISPIDFYLQPAAILNFSAINSTGSQIPFKYQVKDKKLGYSVEEDFDSFSLNEQVPVPNNRNYSIMIYPNNSFPVSVDVTNLSSYYEKTFNCTESNERLTGYATINDSANLDSLLVVSYLLEPGRNVYYGDNAQVMFNSTGDDFYNHSSGEYNISVAAQVENSTVLVFAIAQKNSSYYGGFQQVSLSYQTSPGPVNFSLYKLLGNQSNLTVKGFSGQKNIPLKLKQINIYNSTGASISGFASVEVKLNYEQVNFTLTTDVSQNSNGSFYVPILNISGIDRINVYSSSGAPAKKSFNLAELSSELNISLNEPFNVEDPDGDSLGDLFVDMISYRSTCDVPNYDGSCSLFGGEANRSNVNPLSIVMSGVPISFRMRNSNNITVHFVNVDMLASGPPDALFDSNSSDTQGTSAYSQAWRFGSSGPEIYDYVIIGAPYVPATSSQAGINEDLQINISIPVLYDDDWNAVWNSSAGDNTTNITSNSDLSDYQDYVGTEYELYLNSSVACNESDENLTELCYKDADNNMLWFKIPHFSGVGPENIGVFQDIISTTVSSSSGGGGGGGFVPTVGEEKETSKSKLWDVLSLDKNIMQISEAKIAVNKIMFSAAKKVRGAEITIGNLVEQPDSVENIGGPVYQYIEIKTSDNINDSVISSVKIEFEVGRDWISAYSVNSSTVSMYRWENEWSKLDTKQTGSNNTHLFYLANSPGFSYFVISGQRVNTVVDSEAEAKINIVEPEVKPNQENPQTENKFPWLIFLLVLFVIVPGVGIGTYFLISREKKSAKNAQKEFIEQKQKYKKLVGKD